jgi:hypothetical protein
MGDETGVVFVKKTISFLFKIDAVTLGISI